MLVSSSYLLILAALPFGVLAALPSRIRQLKQPKCSTTIVNDIHVFSVELHERYMSTQITRLQVNLKECVPEDAILSFDWGSEEVESGRTLRNFLRKGKFVLFIGELREGAPGQPIRCVTEAVKNAIEADIVCGNMKENKLAYKRAQEWFSNPRVRNLDRVKHDIVMLEKTKHNRHKGV